MPLDSALLTEAHESAVTLRLTEMMMRVRLLKRISAENPAAGEDAFAEGPEGGMLAAHAEWLEMTDAEREQAAAGIRERVGYYNRIAWELIGTAVTMFDLSDETVTGDVIALLAASMQLRDFHEAGRQIDDSADEA